NTSATHFALIATPFSKNVAAQVLASRSTPAEGEEAQSAWPWVQSLDNPSRIGIGDWPAKLRTYLLRKSCWERCLSCPNYLPWQFGRRLTWLFYKFKHPLKTSDQRAAHREAE